MRRGRVRGVSFTAGNAEIAETCIRITSPRPLSGLRSTFIRLWGRGCSNRRTKECLAYQLATEGLLIERQKPIPVIDEGVRMDCGFRLDLLVEKQVIVEVKAREKLIPHFDAQLLTYLKLTGCTVGLLINFNEKTLISGVRRIVNNYEDLSAAPADSAVKS